MTEMRVMNYVRVLIADDSVIVRERLVSMLSEFSGIEIVGQARDATEAIDAIRRLRPDVVILDIRMPGGSGIDVLRAIKKGRKAVPRVIMLTNFPYSQYRKKCMDAGADFFFDKSSEFENVAHVLKHHYKDIGHMS
jgi:DNA-binding NarL/FixJ family response regulator